MVEKDNRDSRPNNKEGRERLIHFCQHVSHDFAVVFCHVQQLRPRQHVVQVVLRLKVMTTKDHEAKFQRFPGTLEV